MFKQLPIPYHYNPDEVGKIWRVDYMKRSAEAEAWAGQHNLSSVDKDETRICLVLVDVQNTFCIPDFELFVPGAVEDNIRLCEFIYRNLGAITNIALTLDTHTAMQIFHPVFLVNSSGEHPAPATIISSDDVAKGVWKVNPAVAHNLAHRAFGKSSSKFDETFPKFQGDYEILQQHLVSYVRKLEEGGKYNLIIWPYHAMLGGIGHALVSAVEEACFFHNIARHSQSNFQVKGDNPLTENYSVLRPEVLEGPDSQPIAQKNTSFINTLLNFDVVIIAGQAKSHCVAWTIDDLLNEISDQKPQRDAPGATRSHRAFGKSSSKFDETFPKFQSTKIAKAQIWCDAIAKAQSDAIAKARSDAIAKAQIWCDAIAKAQIVKKIYLLEDCTSPVVIPGVVDFTDVANQAFARFAAAGMHLVKSTEPITSWPGISIL